MVARTVIGTTMACALAVGVAGILPGAAQAAPAVAGGTAQT